MVCSCNTDKNYCDTYKCDNYGKFEIRHVKMEDEEFEIERIALLYYVITLICILFIYFIIIIFLVFIFKNIFI
jgi:hypothetical protein